MYHYHHTPLICPHCDCQYDERINEPEFNRDQYFHFDARRICIVHLDGQAPIQMRLIEGGFVPVRD